MKLSQFSPFESSPIQQFLLPFKPTQSQWVARYTIISFALIIRCAVGLGPYSGMGSPPLHGDFEAQRHWMEITYHLPISEWYWYDLHYWGLDYPPLTAFHSWLLGAVGSIINPNWFALNESRGIENDDLKYYMRATVVAFDLLLLFPAVFSYSRWMGKHYKQPPLNTSITAAIILFQPSLIIIDHGHFQYNGIMLALTLISIVNLLNNNYGLASVFFVASIGFKQMALYYAPFIFCYLLSATKFPFIFGFLRGKFGIEPLELQSNTQNFMFLRRFILIGLSVIFTFVSMLLPFIIAIINNKDNQSTITQQLLQILIRVFPFERGLWEDKVSNVWCTLNLIIKLRSIFTIQQLKVFSLVATLLGCLPSLLIILNFPRKHLLPWGFTITSLSFYLFSFQVHEKSILLPLLPISLLMCRPDSNTLSICSWISNIAMFSMFPLLKREELQLQYWVLLFLYNWLIGNFSRPSHRPKRSLLPQASSIISLDGLMKIIIVISYLGVIVIHILDGFIEPPQQYNDLWVITNNVLSCGCFGLFWIWSVYMMFILRNEDTCFCVGKKLEIKQ